jgi:hypothetical protein
MGARDRAWPDEGGDDMHSMMNPGLTAEDRAALCSPLVLERDPRSFADVRPGRPPAPRRNVTRQHAFITILFLVVCALDCAAVATLPPALVSGVVGPALTLIWIGALLTFGMTRWRAQRR